MRRKIKILYAILRLIVEKEPSYLLWSVPQIITNSALSLLAVYVPKRILETLTGISTFEKIVQVILFYSLLLFFFENDEQLSFKSQQLRCRKICHGDPI